MLYQNRSHQADVRPQKRVLFNPSNRLVCLISSPFSDEQYLQRLLIAEKKNLASRQTDGQEWDLQVRTQEAITCVANTCKPDPKP